MIYNALLDNFSSLIEWVQVVKEPIFDFGTKGKTMFNIPFVDAHDFYKLIFKFGFYLFFTTLLIRYIYYPISKKKDYLVTYFLIGISVFMISITLENVKLELGFALGLFAIFGIIRYRTDAIDIKEMTYLFIVIGVSVINALANKKISYIELVFTNSAVILVAWFLERIWLIRHEVRKTITYEKIDLIVPEKRKELIADLEERTGINIERVEVGRINFLRDTARVRIFYFEDKNTLNLDDEYDQNIQDDDD